MLLRAASLLIAMLCVLAPLAEAQARDSLGIFERWGAFRDTDKARCFAIAEPVNPRRGRAWRPFASVGYWPRQRIRGQAHFRFSRQVARNAQVTLSIGAQRFLLVSSSTDAWASDRRMDAAIIAAIRAGTSMSIEARASNGRAFADVYALRGAATAIDAAALGCARVR